MNELVVNVYINNQACTLLYPDTPMAWPPIGTEEPIKGITKEMLQEYFKRHYVPGNMVLAFGGPIVHDQTLKLSQKYFSSLKSEFKPFPKNYFVGSIDEKQNRPGLHFQEAREHATNFRKFITNASMLSSS